MATASGEGAAWGGAGGGRLRRALWPPRQLPAPRFPCFFSFSRPELTVDSIESFLSVESTRSRRNPLQHGNGARRRGRDVGEGSTGGGGRGKGVACAGARAGEGGSRAGERRGEALAHLRGLQLRGLGGGGGGPRRAGARARPRSLKHVRMLPLELAQCAQAASGAGQPCAECFSWPWPCRSTACGRRGTRRDQQPAARTGGRAPPACRPLRSCGSGSLRP